MTEKTYLRLICLLSNAKWAAREQWLVAWKPFSGEPPLRPVTSNWAELATHWAQELQDLNDAHRELEQLYYAGLSRAMVNASLS